MVVGHITLLGAHTRDEVMSDTGVTLALVTLLKVEDIG